MINLVHVGEPFVASPSQGGGIWSQIPYAHVTSLAPVGAITAPLKVPTLYTHKNSVIWLPWLPYFCVCTKTLNLLSTVKQGRLYVW